MGRTSNRRAANSANRRLGISAGAWFAAQSFNGGTRGDAPRMPMLQCSECKREVFTLVDGMCLRCKEPEAYRNFTDQFSVCPVCKRSYLTHTFERVGDSEPMCWNCADLARESMPKCLECHRCVFTLVEGMCFVCHAPVDGKPLRDMTKAQMSEPHTCGVTGRQHVDGMDGNWLDCDEAKRRLGR